MQKANAETLGYVTTMLGRRRYLPDASGSNSKAKGHALRAAINTPIQGSAADVATAAMISISRCPELEAMGWKLLLQVSRLSRLQKPRCTIRADTASVVSFLLWLTLQSNGIPTLLNFCHKESVIKLREVNEKAVLSVQVHDEVILEGPRETAAEAKALVVQHMEKPFNGTNPLLVDLNVDANTAASWYEAK